MANEATRSYYDGVYAAKDFTVADDAGIEKGTLLKMTDPNTAVATSGSGDVFAGIAGREKIADDGRTQLAVYQTGRWEMTCASGASITAGQKVSTSGANVIKTATEAEIAAGKSFGEALETGSDSEVILVDVGRR